MVSSCAIQNCYPNRGSWKVGSAGRATNNPAGAELDRFEAAPYGERYAAVVHSWRRRCEEMIPFFAFFPEVRKAIRIKGLFPSDEAATKLIYLALRNITAKWKIRPGNGMLPRHSSQSSSASDLC